MSACAHGEYLLRVNILLFPLDTTVFVIAKHDRSLPSNRCTSFFSNLKGLGRFIERNLMLLLELELPATHWTTHWMKFSKNAPLKDLELSV